MCRHPPIEPFHRWSSPAGRPPRRCSTTPSARLATSAPSSSASWSAVANGELEVHDQPIVDLRRGRLLGFEALERRRMDLHLAPSAALAKSPGLDVVVEGVEDELQLAQATQLGGHAGQGYLRGRPVPADLTSDLAIGGIRLRAGAPHAADRREEYGVLVVTDVEQRARLRSALLDLGIDAVAVIGDPRPADRRTPNGGPRPARTG